jgi:multicomponent Na+:H+ antiporter subunit E
MGTVIARGAGFLGLWVVLIGFDPVDLAVGVAAAAAATWASLRLLPPSVHRLRLTALPWLGLRFMWQSVIAGIDVASRAFDPRMPLRTGFVVYPTRFPRGPARNTFATVTSLLPGTVPTDDDEEGLLYHCLDVAQPVVDQLDLEERTYTKALAPRRSDA